MASIIKNYSQSEIVVMETSSNFEGIALHEKLSKCQPRHSAVVKSMKEYLENIYVDFNLGRPMMFDIQSNSVIEMRGLYGKSMVLYDCSMVSLLKDCMVDIVEDQTDCLLFTLWLDYLNKLKRKRKQQSDYHFYDFIGEIFSVENLHVPYLDGINEIDDEDIKQAHTADYNYLVLWFSYERTDITNVARASV